jgi:iron(III) transport system substrate-binding protein
MPAEGKEPMRAITLIAILSLSLLAAGAAQAKTRLLVYSTLVPEYIESFKQAFEADHPDIELALQRDSTGVITSRLLAEKANPRADVIWGLAITSMMILDREGMLLPHAPRDLAQIKPLFRDAKNPPAWVGMEAWAAAVCFNTVEGKKLNIERPAAWAALLKPEYKSRLVMPHPASSGTGYLHVSAWLQMWGEEAGWRYMDRLHENIHHYTHSGSKPCRDAAQGEYLAGISYELVGASHKAAGAPIDVAIMPEGGGWEMDAAAIIKGTANLAAARALADWSASRKANEMYARYATLVAFKGIEPAMPGYPPGVEASLIKNDFAWAAANRDRILAEWQRRYEGKAEKR